LLRHRLDPNVASALGPVWQVRPGSRRDGELAGWRLHCQKWFDSPWIGNATANLISDCRLSCLPQRIFAPGGLPAKTASDNCSGAQSPFILIAFASWESVRKARKSRTRVETGWGFVVASSFYRYFSHSRKTEPPSRKMDSEKRTRRNRNSSSAGQTG
jgi:hypothetical protein